MTSTNGTEFRVSLRIYGADLDPEAITRLMGLRPTHSHRRGDARPSGLPTPYSQGVWHLQSDIGSQASLEEHLEWVISRLAEREAVLREISLLGLEVDLFVGVLADDSNVGFSVSPKPLAEFARLGVALDFDVYFVGQDREVTSRSG